MEENIKQVDDLIFYKLGDLYLKCSCGHEELQTEFAAVEGIQFVLPASNKDCIRLVCKGCGHKLELFYKETENADEILEYREKVKVELDKVKEELNKLEETNNELGNVENA